MSRKLTTQLRKHTLWLSIVLHLLLLLSFSMTLTFKLPVLVEKSPELYVPSYVYQPPATTAVSQQAAALPSKETPANKEGELSMGRASATKRSTAALNMMRQNATTNYSKESEPVHLLGDKKVAKPLIKLLGKAIFAHLMYPKIAVDFRLRGTASVGFLVHPDGYVTEIQLVKSSGTEVLDNAALSAIRQISPVKNVNAYIKEPKFLVANIIFR